ncbi:hypothetical protein RN001_001032 [Aquatica leii]|uniref:Beta-mannosidase n=1 Tax=Aquatica leii TaxID=1421715 RepID=A0AAN7SCI8_9COLE|nr:hypothetical protein RN001_001032 [Aquatica leii]
MYSTYRVLVICVIRIFSDAVFVNGIKYSLDSSNWLLDNRDKGYTKLQATVPGGVYTVLMEANVIDDVFYGFNDIETRWVSKTNWNYSTEFFLENDVLIKKEKIKLVFEGIDTFSTIFLNDQELGVTENMFVRYIFDVQSYLKRGYNRLEVRLKSPVNEAKKLFDEQSKNYSIVPLCVPVEYNGECHVNHIRKTQASFSWDWGPALPSIGIWKSVYLQGYDTVIIRDVTIKTENATKNFWNIDIYVYLDGCMQDENVEGIITATINTDIGKTVLKTRNLCTSTNSNGEHVTILSGSIDKSYVKLWWPNGYGNANLYTVYVSYSNVKRNESSNKTFKIGFRVVELVQDKIESGLLFYFKINNVPIFAKGSNSIPINILPELAQNKETIKHLLQSAKDVNMNMLRVWGGGNYEADVFYELADEYGIMIWQDFMFACNMYPATEEFLENVKNEVRHQVRRLQHHASIIMWAGNNENEVALRQNWYGSASKFKTFKADYKKLYVETIQTELLRSDNTRPFLVSSPSNGLQSIQQDYVALFPQSNYYGDIHFYNYFFDSWNTTNYPIPRFSSEYGYQALPSVNTLLTATNSISDLNISSKFLQKRQHLPDGFKKMTNLINFRLRLPDENSPDFYKAYIFNSQVMQAMSVKIETEHNRQWRSSFNEQGLGHVMGSLYWQLNDVWVAPTWSGIDFKGNWKMMQYFSKHFFAPVIVTGDITLNGDLNVYVVSDLTHTIFNANVTMFVYNWDSMTPLHSHIIKTNIEANQSKKVLTVKLENDLLNIANGSCGATPTRKCFIYFTVNSDNSEATLSNYVFPVPLKFANINYANVTITAIKEHRSPDQQFTITISTNEIALFVWLEVNNNIKGRFSDNGFLQITNEKNVTFTPTDYVILDDLIRSLTVTHLMSYM